MSHVTCYMSHLSHVTNMKLQTILPKTQCCHIFLESSGKIQFNDHDKNVACNMCYMSHVTHVTCHKYQVTNNFTKDPMCHIFLESLCKIQFNDHLENVACNMCHMSGG